MSDKQEHKKPTKKVFAVGQVWHPGCGRTPAGPRGRAQGCKTVSIQQQFGETRPGIGLERGLGDELNIRKKRLNGSQSDQLAGVQIGNLPQP
jgi:hypothetical protein